MCKDKFKINDETLNSLGLKLMADLTIHDAALWMVMGTDPDAHEDRCDSDPEYLQYYCDHRYGEAYVLEICGFIQSAARQGLIKANSGGDINDNHFDINTTYISKVEWLAWCQKEGYASITVNTSNPLSNEDIQPKVTSHKSNRNLLDSAIDKAIENAKNMELADVFLELKELAIGGCKPFTGFIGTDATNDIDKSSAKPIKKGSLCYTNDEDDVVGFTKGALKKRLLIRKKRLLEAT